MKALRWTILAGTMSALLMAGGVATAQDDAYMTPSKAKVIRQKQQKERSERIAKLEAQRQRQKAEYEKMQSEQEKVSDWYNRRDMKVTIEEMEDNLDELEGTATRRAKGGKYSQRLRRFGNNSDAIVLNNVDRVYIVDDLDYDPWTNSYYGRDWNSGVNININTYPYYGPRYGAAWRYNRWYDPWYYGGWYDPWYYGGWYDPWYYSRWYDPWYYGGRWGFSYTWGYPSYGYSHGYWHGYHDGSYYAPTRQSRRYNSYGRASGRYREGNYDNYGSRLGRTEQAVQTRTVTDPTFRSRINNSGRRYDNSGTTRTNPRWGNDTYSTPTRTYTPTRSTNEGGSVIRSTPTRTTSPTRNTGTTGSGGRRR